MHRKALAIVREMGNRKSESMVLNRLGIISLERGDHDESEGLHRKALAIDRETGNRKGESQELYRLG